MRRRVALPAAVVLGASAMLVGIPVHATRAAAGVPCSVRNVTQGTRGVSFRGMVAAAHAGDRLRVRATCTGGVLIGKDLVIVGAGPHATLSGRGRVRVLTVIDGIPGPGRPTVRIRGLRIVRGRDTGGGGGIYVRGAKVDLIDSVVADSVGGNNRRVGEGGGLLVARGTVTLRRSVIRDNRATDGGGIGITGGAVTIIDSVVRRNRALGGGGIRNRRGGSLTVVDSVVGGNYARWQGGGINNSGRLRLLRTTLRYNRADNYGGGLDLTVWTDTVEVAGSTFARNSAETGGGGISVAAGNLEAGVVSVVDTTVTTNRAGVHGGGIYLNDPVPVVLSGATAVTGNDPDDCFGMAAC